MNAKPANMAGVPAGFTAIHDGSLRMRVRRGYEPWAALLGGGARQRNIGTVGGGRQAHPIIELPSGEQAVVRAYRRGGALRHLNRSRYFLGDRAFAELRATERARIGGVRVPVVLAATQRGQYFGYIATLATLRIPAARDAAEWLRTASTDARQALLAAAGRQIARMHAAGVAHPDLNLRNLLVSGESPEPTVYLLDFDRARIFETGVPGWRRRRDLRRLGRSARKLGLPLEGDGGWDALRRGYGAEWPLPEPR